MATQEKLLPQPDLEDYQNFGSQTIENKSLTRLGGLANLAEGWKNANEFAEELDKIVQQRYQNISQEPEPEV